MASVQQPLSMETSPSPLSSRPGFPVTQHRTRQRVRLSVRKGACSSRNPPTSTGNPGERSRGICSYAFSTAKRQGKPPIHPCHPDRSAPRISYCAAPSIAACAAFRKESRMTFNPPPSSTGNPGVAKWRDLQLRFLNRKATGKAALPFVIPSAAEGSAVSLSPCKGASVPSC
jgi:hypothetical protein